MRSMIFGMMAIIFAAGCTKSDDTSADYTELKIPKVESTASNEEPASAVPGDQAPAELKIGDAAPIFADIVGVDDKNHSLDEFKDAKAVAVVFTCNKCPVAVDYEDRLIEYQKEYADKGVQLVAINVNNAEADKLPAMKVRAEEKGYTFPYLYDESQKSARDYGAEVTPHVFLLDTQRKVAYVGPVDDNPDAKQVTKAYLRDATEAVLAGKAPETTEVDPVGCGIQYE
jgi:peroxiredoxin